MAGNAIQIIQKETETPVKEGKKTGKECSGKRAKMTQASDKEKWKKKKQLFQSGKWHSLR